MEAKKQAAVELTLLNRYEQMAAQGKIALDPAQLEALSALDALAAHLARPAKTGLATLFRKLPPEEPRGIYLWGDVGRGKSMLMDLFFAHGGTERKRRVHFHAFMQEVHAHLHRLRRDGSLRGRDGADPVIALSRRIAEDTRLLCFDELQATDVADATLLYRLFQALLDARVIVVSTSNRPPEKLYTGGVQGERFDKFVALLEARMTVLALSGVSDYRRQAAGATIRWFTPPGREADAFIDAQLSGLPVRREAFNVQGRTLDLTLYGADTGRFRFADLCAGALGAADYLALAKRLKRLVVSDIPKLTPEKRNEAKRFVTLVDVLYEHRIPLIATAAAIPEALYTEGDGAFEFQRTVSRLIEMQSPSWNPR